MTPINLDTSDEGKAANIAARAALLFARVSGYIAENAVRADRGLAPAYHQDAFEYAIQDCFPETEFVVTFEKPILP